jgi:hypothetical protein
MKPTDSLGEALVAEFFMWPASAPRCRSSPRRPAGISAPDEEGAQACRGDPGEAPKRAILAGSEEGAYRLYSPCGFSPSV